MKYKLTVTANTFIYPNIEKAAMALKCLVEAEKTIGPTGESSKPTLTIEPVWEEPEKTPGAP